MLCVWIKNMKMKIWTKKSGNFIKKLDPFLKLRRKKENWKTMEEKFLFEMLANRNRKSINIRKKLFGTLVSSNPWIKETN